MRERKLNRLNSFDYSRDGSYFVTFCLKNRQYSFGAIADNQITYSLPGKIVIQSIEWLMRQYTYIHIHEYVVMPDHVHLLIEITRVGTGHGLFLKMSPKIKSLSELIGA